MQSVNEVAAGTSKAGPCARVKMSGQKTVKFTREDLDMIEAAGKRFDWVAESDLIRTAIRVGLESLLSDPSPLGKRPIHPSAFSGETGPEATVTRSPAADGLTPNTQALLAEDPEADERRKSRGAARRRKKPT